ncbi:hypothetical protein R5N98_03750 [Tenacibaculum maritimum]|uniref:hypothetical protein n=1 Tax=Tenacibaculum maritimum TaxID=107401 RepID=UPI0012E5F773|nr:hypothetical protein [Tenacibaculum maritimum]CAA0248210.1 conserved hypothetical protein [Tenacibaculum maritimum]
MIDFLKEGDRLKGIFLGDNVKMVSNKLGKPEEIIGDKYGGYLYYNELRFGYDDCQKINELSIEFSRLEKKYKFENLETELQGVLFSSSFKISAKTRIHEFIKFINFLKIVWEADSTPDNNYFIVRVKSGPVAVFDLEDGKLFRISVVTSLDSADL